eukprot:COSAG02_NODE_49461_length_326_cov_1.599119_1_plen_54_part_01
MLFAAIFAAGLRGRRKKERAHMLRLTRQSGESWSAAAQRKKYGRAICNVILTVM